METHLTIVQAITLGIAMIGAVLGIMNTWLTVDSRKVKLRLRPKLAIQFHSSEMSVTWDITNYSQFPITITEIGVRYHWSKQKGCVPFTKELPKELKQRESFSILKPVNVLEMLNGKRPKCLYAKTDCGIEIRGRSPALKQLIIEANNKGSTK